MLVHWIVAANLIVPIASFQVTYASGPNVQDGPAGLSIRSLQTLAGENPDGTLLVAVDEMWPPIRIAVQSLLDCNLTYPADGFKPGMFLSIKSSLFQSFPILTSTVQAPAHHMSDMGAPEPSTHHDQHQSSDGPLKDFRRAAPYHKVAKIGLRDSANLCSQLTIRAPILLNISYYGSYNPKVGDKMTWVYSIQQGNVPLAWITLRFSGYPVNSYISRNFSVPWDFQSTGKVTNGSITYKVQSSDLSGTYSLQQVVLATQACPDFVYAHYQIGGWIYYSYNSVRIKNVIGPQTHSLKLLSGYGTVQYAATYVFGSGSFLTVIPPELIELKYIGNFSVAWGEDLIWEYKVRQGTYALSEITLRIFGPVVQDSPTFDSFHRDLSFDVRSNGPTTEGSISTGRLMWKVTSSWLEGEYLRGSLRVVLKYTPRDQNYFMISEELWDYYFRVHYYIDFPYDRPCQRSGWLVDSYAAPSFIVGDPRFQVNGFATARLMQPLLLMFNYTGPAAVGRYDTLLWKYKISVPSMNYTSIVVRMRTCGTPYSVQGPCYYESLSLRLLSTSGVANVNSSMTEYEGTAEAEVASMTRSFMGRVTFWYEGVELRSPAQAGSDVFLTSFYNCYWGGYWNGYSYYYNQYCSAGSYNSYIPGTPSLIPSDVVIRDESNRIFQLVGASCLDSELSLPTGPVCQGSGIKPNMTDGPPSMLGDGPCELPYLEWQTVARRELLETAWSGGLGRFMTDEMQVWVCLDEPNLPQTCLSDWDPFPSQPSPSTPRPSSGRGGRALACYGYNEATELFVFWGPNTRLKLV